MPDAHGLRGGASILTLSVLFSAGTGLAAPADLSFEVNQGQADPRVQFLTRGSGQAFLFGSAGAVVVRSVVGTSPSLVRMKLLGASSKARATGEGKRASQANYFIGKDPRRWRTNVPTYARVQYEDLYPGIDLVYYGNQHQLEYDFVVRPGGDPTRIRMEFSGGDGLRVDDQGDLVMNTGDGALRQRRPMIYQEWDGVRREVTGGYVIQGKGRIGFAIEAYDPTRALIIDPILAYSTYLGGSGGDFGRSVAVDAAGNTYVAGYTASVDFPITGTAPQAAHAGSYDAFVTKLDSTSTVVYSTYLGGSADDYGMSIAVDRAGNAYAAGSTRSSDFPTTWTASQTALAGAEDGFVAKLNSKCALIYSTYLGGQSTDIARGIAVDVAGNAYVAGFTSSANFPTTLTASQPLKGGGLDAFVTKLAPMSRRIYSTYLGGGLDDSGNAIALDVLGNVYVTGTTWSTDFPTAGTPSQPTNAGNVDAFVTKLGPTSARLYSTYLGGSGPDDGDGVAVDIFGNAFVAGSTRSWDFPTAGTPSQPSFAGASDAFVTKLGRSSRLVYSTYLGGSLTDYGLGIAVDRAGNVHVTGYTVSADFPVAAPPSSRPGLWDAFVSKLDSTSAVVDSTYLGGANNDYGWGIAVDLDGNAYVTGYTLSEDFPTTCASANAGGYDAFVSKVEYAP